MLCLKSVSEAYHSSNLEWSTTITKVHASSSKANKSQSMKILWDFWQGSASLPSVALPWGKARWQVLVAIKKEQRPVWPMDGASPNIRQSEALTSGCRCCCCCCWNIGKTEKEEGHCWCSWRIGRLELSPSTSIFSVAENDKGKACGELLIWKIIV